MLPAESARRLVTELQDALDACSERQRQLEESLRVSRRLLQAWEPAHTPAPEPLPGPESKEKDPSPACTPSPQDLKELEFLTRALEKAVRVRKGISKAGERNRATNLKSGSIATAPSTTASAPPQASSRTGSRVSVTRPTKAIHQTKVPVKEHPECRFLSVGDSTHVGIGTQATRPGSGLRDQQMSLLAAPQATEAFTLKEKGTLLQLPMAFRKAAAKNSRLWAQLNFTQTSDSRDATSSAKTQFIQNMQMASGWSGPRPSAMEVKVETQRLRKVCMLLRLHMQEELSAAPADWMQEYRSLLTLEGLQAIVEQYLHRLQDLRAAVTEPPPEPYLVGNPPQALSSCRGEEDSSWSPQILLYSSTQELQTLAALKLRVAMLDQQIHLEKVLMAELLPLISTQEPQGPTWLTLCRAAHSLLCEGSERFLTVLRDDPAD
ncbi:tubulin epsilon and delta complex protein 2 isoform X1 [Castor canadensis]